MEGGRLAKVVVVVVYTSHNYQAAWWGRLWYDIQCPAYVYSHCSCAGGSLSYDNVWTRSGRFLALGGSKVDGDSVGWWRQNISMEEQLPTILASSVHVLDKSTASF